MAPSGARASPRPGRSCLRAPRTRDQRAASNDSGAQLTPDKKTPEKTSLEESSDELRDQDVAMRAMDVEQLYEEAISLVENQDTIGSVMEIEDQSVLSERLISIIKTGRAVEDDEGPDEDTAERVRNLKFSSITAMRKSIGVADDEWTAAWKKTPSRTHHNELVAKTLVGMTAGERAKAFEVVSPANKPSTSTVPKSGGIPSAPLASEIAEALLAATKHQLTEALANSADPKIKKEHMPRQVQI